MQWVPGKRVGPQLAALTSIVVAIALALSGVAIGCDGNAIMPGPVCPPFC
jgi:hypothetical protein